MKLAKGDLEPIDSLPTIERYLRYTIDFHEPISCFFKRADKHFQSHSFEIKPGTSEISLHSPSGVFFLEELRDYVNNEPDKIISISFRVQQVVFFGKAHIDSIQTDRIVLVVESPIYKLQRRATFRFTPDPGKRCKLSIQLDNELLEMPPLDLSAGGASFLLKDEQAKTLFVGEREFKGKLSFEGETAAIQLKLVSVVEMKLSKEDELRLKSTGEKGPTHWKAGFKFTSIPVDTEKAIARAAHEYTIKTFSSKIK